MYVFVRPYELICLNNRKRGGKMVKSTFNGSLRAKIGGKVEENLVKGHTHAHTVGEMDGNCL